MRGVTSDAELQIAASELVAKKLKKCHTADTQRSPVTFERCGMTSVEKITELNIREYPIFFIEECSCGFLVIAIPT